MKYAILYSSKTGNTAQLAQAIQSALPAGDCQFFGAETQQIPDTECVFVGFWTDKGTCDADAAQVLTALRGKKVFLFGTAGFGENQAYFDKILERVAGQLDASNTLLGGFMCQGKMPISVRERYKKMLAETTDKEAMQGMLDNFDRAAAHPNQEDLAQVQAAVRAAMEP